jgi:threonine dehydratase
MAAIRLYVGKAHTIAEGAGAVSLAATVKMRGELRDKRVGVVLSGGNLTTDMLRDILKRP